jgi:hypothetical protein
LGNNEANLEGELIYKILYIGADNSLYSATLSDKYHFNPNFNFSPYSINTDEITLHSLCECENHSTRVLGPRKVNIKSKIICRTFALSPILHKPELIGAHDPSCIENLILESPAIITKKCESNPIALSDTTPIDPQVDNIRIVDVSTSVAISECQATIDKIEVRGEALAKILYCNDAESENELLMIRKLPFSTSILCEGINPSYECCCYAVVNEESASVDETSIKTDVLLTVNAQAQTNKCVPYVSDAFSTEKSVNNELEELSITKGLTSHIIKLLSIELLSK